MRKWRTLLAVCILRQCFIWWLGEFTANFRRTERGNSRHSDLADFELWKKRTNIFLERNLMRHGFHHRHVVQDEPKVLDAKETRKCLTSCLQCLPPRLMNFNRKSFLNKWNKCSIDIWCIIIVCLRFHCVTNVYSSFFHVFAQELILHKNFQCLLLELNGANEIQTNYLRLFKQNEQNEIMKKTLWSMSKSIKCK